MKSEPDPTHTSVRPRTVPLTPFVQAVSPHRIVGTPPSALACQNLLQQLSGPDELLVLHSGRFDDARGLLRTWLASTPDTHTAIACVLDPGPGASPG